MLSEYKHKYQAAKTVFQDRRKLLEGIKWNLLALPLSCKSAEMEQQVGRCAGPVKQSSFGIPMSPAHRIPCLFPFSSHVLTLARPHAQRPNDATVMGHAIFQGPAPFHVSLARILCCIASLHSPPPLHLVLIALHYFLHT
jgi:hypothetical protein